PARQLRWEAAASVAEIGREVNRLAWKGELIAGDCLNLLGIVALRVTRVASLGATLSKPLFGFDRATLKDVEDLSLIAGNLIQRREKIPQAWNAIQTLIAYLKGSEASRETELAV